MEFAWFYTLKFLIILVFLYFIVNPFVKQYRQHQNLKVKSKTPYVLALCMFILVFFNPIKIDNSTSAERTRHSYDTPIMEPDKIKLQAKERYGAPTNEEEIQSIVEK